VRARALPGAQVTGTPVGVQVLEAQVVVGGN
jgi:hypothetical protein